MLLTVTGRFLAPYRRPIVVIVLLQLGATIASLYLPALNADIIDEGVVQGDVATIIRLGAVMLAVSLLQVVGSVAAVWFGARTAMAFGRDLRSAVFGRVLDFSSREVAGFGAPSLITRTTNDVQQVQMLVMLAFVMAVTAPIMMIGGVVMAVREDVGLSWLVAVAVPVLGVAIGLIIARMVPGFRLMQARLDTINRVLREQITGIRVLRAFVREPYESHRFGVANQELADVSMTVGRWMSAMFPVVMLVLNASSVAVLWFGGIRVDAGAMEIGSLTAFLAYLVQILMAVMMGTFMLVMIPRAAVSADRIGAVLDTESSVVPPAAGVADIAAGAVRFDGAGFTYPGAEHPVLSDVTFTARPGQVTAVVGSTGAGKTTLLSLVPRLVDATAGRVSLGGVDVRDVDPEVLWSRIGLVPQAPYLFSGTVADNLRFGKEDATEEEMWEALEVAQARDFVAAMPGGLDAPIAQGGTNVSGGQRQRLAIARALVRRPAVYLFDDTFSALDLATESRLRRALRTHISDATVLLVAQRVSSIVDADQIAVLEAGSVVGLGTHVELLETCPTYAEIVASQVVTEEAS